jgi:RNA polymerase sigma factor (sigma-70 family)
MQKDNARRVLGLVMRTGLAPSLTDSQLLQAFVQDRAAEAFAEIVRRHGSLVFGVCRRVLRHDQDAEDAFQATFLVLARKATAVRPLEALGRWLYTVAFRTAQKAKSRRYRDQVRCATLAAQVQAEAAAPAEPADWLPLLDQELNRLPDRERRPIVLCDLLGRSRKEAAQELGLNEGTLSSRLARGRDRLRRQLESRGVVPAITAAGLTLAACSAPAAVIDATLALPSAVSSATAKLAEGVIRTMTLQSTMKGFAILGTMLFVGGGGLLWGLAPGHHVAEQNKPAANVAELPDNKELAKNEDKLEERKEEPKKVEADAPKKDDVNDDLQKLKGTWKVVLWKGGMPVIALPKGGALRKPKYFLIDRERLTWDNGDPNDAGRLTAFLFRLVTDDGRKEIEISLDGKFEEPKQNGGLDQRNLLSGGYNLVADRLEVDWSNKIGQDELSKRLGIQANSIILSSAVLQRVNSNDLQDAVKQAAADAPDFQALQGKWRIVRVVGASDDDVQVGHAFLFQDKMLRFLHGNADDITRPVGPILLKTNANPKQIDYVPQDYYFRDKKENRPRTGIYRIDKDRLEICWRLDRLDENQQAPQAFEVANGAKALQLIFLERVADKPPDDKAQLVDLRKALVEALQAQVDSMVARLPAGRDSLINVLDASERLMQAQLELATDKKTRIQVLDANIKRALLYEKNEISKLNASKATAHDVAQAKAQRLLAEILLEQEKEAPTLNEKARIVDLKKARVEALQAQVDSLESRIQSGRDPLITILDAAERLMQAQLKLATDKKTRIQVLEAFLQRVRLYEKLRLSELSAGKATAHEVAQVRAKRLMAEILLEQEKAK